MTESAAEHEATGEDITFEWLGHEITLPPTADDLDINATRAFSKGDLIAFLEGVVGKTQFAKIERAHRKEHQGRFTNRDLIPLGDKIAELYGFESLGN